MGGDERVEYLGHCRVVLLMAMLIACGSTACQRQSLTGPSEACQRGLAAISAFRQSGTSVFDRNSPSGLLPWEAYGLSPDFPATIEVRDFAWLIASGWSHVSCDGDLRPLSPGDQLVAQVRIILACSVWRWAIDHPGSRMYRRFKNDPKRIALFTRGMGSASSQIALPCACAMVGDWPVGSIALRLLSHDNPAVMRLGLSFLELLLDGIDQTTVTARERELWLELYDMQGDRIEARGKMTTGDWPDEMGPDDEP